MHLSSSKYLDIASMFHQIEMELEDIHKTGFRDDNGHYEFVKTLLG